RHHRQRRRPRLHHRRHARGQRHVLRPRQPGDVRRPPPAAPAGRARRGGRPRRLALQRRRQRRHRRRLPRRRRHDRHVSPRAEYPPPVLQGARPVAGEGASTAVNAAPARPVALPGGFRISLDRRTRVTGDGTVLVGGSPVRRLRLTPAGRALVDRLVAGEPVPATAAARALARRLLDAGLAHPRPPALAGPADVAVVIPVHDDRDGLAATLAALAHSGLPAPAEGVAGSGAVLVVDDASPARERVGAAGRAGGATVLRRSACGGPAAARNDGWRATRAGLVAFLDANCEPEPGWLDALLPLFGDPLVAAVAPRVASAAAPGARRWLTAYEDVFSPLDLGPREANVRPRGPVAYVPTAALVVRRAALEAGGGFDERLTVGEDVDLVWRLVAAGWTVRYEPRATVRHPMRPTLRAWLAQRYRYGTSAAALARRH